MPAITRHYIVTALSEDRYTARCEYEVDGEAQLCHIAIGGFSTRTAAREACKRGYPEAAGR
ncbi:hypothetical protein A4X17_05295 [Plantibacter sp. H53]|nr:hypothetical protein A4X17_05295 [Plantibacter sp. H53]